MAGSQGKVASEMSRKSVSFLPWRRENWPGRVTMVNRFWAPSDWNSESQAPDPFRSNPDDRRQWPEQAYRQGSRVRFNLDVCTFYGDATLRSCMRGSRGSTSEEQQSIAEEEKNAPSTPRSVDPWWTSWTSDIVSRGADPSSAWALPVVSFDSPPELVSHSSESCSPRSGLDDEADITVPIVGSALFDLQEDWGDGPKCRKDCPTSGCLHAFSMNITLCRA
eukprot:Hpha_TRINITY_DN15030_c0_g1::TRINITY_DN15030_c0_g1_i7::g.123013::m.123013